MRISVNSLIVSTLEILHNLIWTIELCKRDMSPDNFPFEIHPDLKKQLKTQQDNFIERLQTGLSSLFTFDQAGKFGETKTISGEELANSRNFC